MNNPSTEIIIGCQQGSVEAFRELVAETQPFAFSFALKLLCNAEEAKDVVQEAYIRIWQNISRFDIEVKFTTWMYRIVANLCYDNLKHKKRKAKLFIENDASSDPASNENIAIKVEVKEKIEMIKKLSDGLAPKQRLVFVLRDFHDLEIKEVCDITGLSMGSVKTNLYLARKAIREKMRD